MDQWDIPATRIYHSSSPATIGAQPVADYCQLTRVCIRRLALVQHAQYAPSKTWLCTRALSSPYILLSAFIPASDPSASRTYLYRLLGLAGLRSDHMVQHSHLRHPLRLQWSIHRSSPCGLGGNFSVAFSFCLFRQEQRVGHVARHGIREGMHVSRIRRLVLI